MLHFWPGIHAVDEANGVSLVTRVKVCVCVYMQPLTACRDPFIQAIVQQGFDRLWGDLIALGV